MPWIAAGVVVLGIAVERFRRSDPDPSPARVLVARHEVPAGQPVTAIDFTPRAFAEGDPADALTDQELHRLRGQRTIRPLAAGEVLLLSAVAPVPLGKRLPFGARAYVLERGAGLPLSVGDRVDVFGGGEGERASRVAENLPIVAVNEDGAPMAAVPDAVVRLLEETRRRGGVTVVLRRPDEPVAPEVPRGPSRRGVRAIPVVEGDQ